MKYIGEFKNIYEYSYKVEIITDTIGEDEEIQLSGEPVVIDYESDDESAYKPYKCSSATISILMREANFDFNDAFANRVRVNIYKENRIIWCGFATPNAYSQSYEDYLDSFELECQDGISTLQYYDYEYIPTYTDYGTWDSEHPYNNGSWDDAITTHNKATNFFHLVMQMNKKLGGMYENIYVTDSIFNPYNRDISILDSIFISENNFFDEDGKPLKMLDILEEICKYCGLTCVAYGNDLYFLSYDAIAICQNTYFKYERVNDTKYTQSKVDLKSDFNIHIDSFSQKGCKINIDSVYNHAVVKDDLYSIDSLTPSIDDDSKWIRTEQLDSANMPHDVTDSTITYVNENSNSKNYGEVHIKNVSEGKQWVFLRYHGYDWTKDLNNRYIFYYYNGDSNNYEIDDETNVPIYDNLLNNKNFTWHTTYSYNGACIVEYAVIPVDSWDDEIRTVKFDTAIMIHTTSKADSELDYGSNSVRPSDWDNNAVQPMVKVLIQPQLMKKGDYIVISGDMAVFHLKDHVPVDEGMNEKADNLWIYQRVSLKCGDLYWDGEQWVNERTAFKLPFEYKKDQKAFNNFIPIKNIVTYDMKLDKEGYCVPCLPNNYANEEGKINTIELTIYRPKSFCSDKVGRTFLIKNLDIQVVGQKDEIINDDAENSEYSSVKPINGNVAEYDNTNCKICTWDNKRFNWSQTFYIKYYQYDSTHKRFYQGGLSFIDDDTTVSMGTPLAGEPYLITDLLGDTEYIPTFIFKSVDVLYDVSKGYVMRPEELIISHIVEQYNNPTLNITVNFKNDGEVKPYSRFTYNSQFPDFIFTVDKVSYNLMYNEAVVKLINKKIEYETQQN